MNPYVCEVFVQAIDLPYVSLGKVGKELISFKSPCNIPANTLHKKKVPERRLFWVSRNSDHADRIQVRPGNYSPADPLGKVKYPGKDRCCWGPYPEIHVNTEEDIPYALRIVIYAYSHY